NGLTSLASTSTVTGSPWCASGTSSGVARARGRVEATTVIESCPATGGWLPSDTVKPTAVLVPFGTSGAAVTCTVVPVTARLRPAPARSVTTVSGSPSGSVTYRDRSRAVSSPAAASTRGLPVLSGGPFRPGSTTGGSVSTAVRPSGSSTPSPSVTSTVSAAGPE